ncbi:ABC transporter permease [Coralliovum pocilloporae]|uniref:ABC transporter permease n=1 Tax=Coralliovum pocilloporae TaxID=3066369 RepID=UPI003306D078
MTDSPAPATQPAIIKTGRNLPIWMIASWLVVLSVLAPIGALFYLALQPSDGVWGHLVSTVLPRATWTTLLLMAGVGSVTAFIGVTTAWLVSMCHFPGRRLFDWLLLVPLAMPTYIVAFAYVEILDFTGPVQTALRQVLGVTSARDYWFPEVRSLGGAVFVMSVVLYPYVYLTTRAMFLMQSACMLDVARTLGSSPLHTFFRVALPLARPAIAVGVTLALMECVNDIGAVEFFGVKTLTFTIYDTWLNRGSLAGAAQIACVMLLFVLGLVIAERFARRKQRFHITSKRYQALPNFELRGAQAGLASLLCATPVLLGFAFPAALLASSAVKRLTPDLLLTFIEPALNSLMLASFAAAATVGAGVVIAYTQRYDQRPITKLAARLGSIGYAVPGTVLAVGILIPLASLDNAVDGFMRSAFGISTGLLLAGSGTALVYAYSVRFLAVSIGGAESGLSRVTTSLDMAARTLGRSAGETLRDVHLPIIRTALVSAAMLVFVDCMKELPATILLRPFNFDTLATVVYTQASLEAFEDAAPAALMIVLVGLIPVALLARTSKTSHRSG